MPTKPRKAAKPRAPAKKPKTKALAKVQALAPRTTTTDPEERRGIVFLPQRTAGVYVNEDTGMTQSTVWACIRVISESLAGMPWRTGTISPTWTTNPIAHPNNDWLLNYSPNPETTAFMFRETLWAWALGWGNGYAEIERNLFTGEPVALWQLHPSRVKPMRDGADNLVYEVTNDGREPTYLQPRNMFHLMGPSPDGLVGWSVIRMHARTIGLAMAQEENAATFNANDSTPGGVLEHPGKLSEQARKNLDESWNRRHRGPSNRRTVAILEEGLKWSQTSIDPNDSKLVEQMQLTPSMICRIFGVPPHKVAASIPNASNMYSNVEQNELAFVKDTLRPWAERGESEADIKLFGRNNQSKLVTFIDLRERERGDTSAQTDHVERMLFCGVYTLNMALQYLGHPGIGPKGDQRYIQSAMIPIEMAGKDQAPPEDATDEPEAESPTMDEDDTLARVQTRALSLLTDACRRILKQRDGQMERCGSLSADWLAKHRDYCREAVSSAAGVLAECIRAPLGALDVSVSLFVDKHLASIDSEATPESKALELRELLLAAAAAKEVA